MHPLDQHVIVHQADQEHPDKSSCNPVKLPAVRARKLGVYRRAVNFQHAQPADGQHEAHQHPVKIAE